MKSRPAVKCVGATPKQNIPPPSKCVGDAHKGNKSTLKGVGENRKGNIQRGMFSDISRACCVNRSSVTRVFSGQKTSARIAQALAQRLGKTHAELWPGRYPEAEYLEALAADKKGGQK